MKEKSTSSPVDFLVNRIALRESGQAQQMTATSGRTCLEQFEKSGLGGSWEKTFAALLAGTKGWYSTRCSLTWKLKVTKSSRFYFQLAPSTPRIKENGFGLLPTNQARDWKGPQGRSYLNKADDLPGVVMKGLLKTPCVMDGEVTSGKANPVSGNSGTLAQEIMSEYPPTMAQDCGTKVTGLENQDSLVKRAREITGKTSQLNPLFVEEMMGYPTGWTLLPFLENPASPHTQKPFLSGETNP